MEPEELLSCADHEEWLEAVRQRGEPEPRGYELFEPVVLVRPGQISIGVGSRIDSFVKLEGGEGLVIGRYVHVASFAHVGIGGGRTILEDYCAVASGGKVISGSNSPRGLSMSASAPHELQIIERKITSVERFAFVATNAVVMPGVTLGEGAVLAAGAVATRDVPAWEIWAGVPARRIADRRRFWRDFCSVPCSGCVHSDMPTLCVCVCHYGLVPTAEDRR